MAIGDRAKTHPPTIRAALTEKRRGPEAVLEHIGKGDDVIVGRKLIGIAYPKFRDELQRRAREMDYL